LIPVFLIINFTNRLDSQPSQSDILVLGELQPVIVGDGVDLVSIGAALEQCFDALVWRV